MKQNALTILAITMFGFCAMPCAWADSHSADAVISELNETISLGNELLEKARTDSDVALMDCINSQLVNAKGFLNVAQNSASNLRDAQTRNDEAAIAHNEKLLELASTKSNEIQFHMKQCSSGVIKYTGETSLKANYDCKYPPCATDAAKDPTTSEGITAYEQNLTDELIPKTTSPYL